MGEFVCACRCHEWDRHREFVLWAAAYPKPDVDEDQLPCERLCCHHFASMEQRRCNCGSVKG